jgi:hypothetical protein
MKLNEDWLATIIGLAIVAVVALGLIGPGPQNVTITAEPGETTARDVIDRQNARISGRIGAESVQVAGDAGFTFVCDETGIHSLPWDAAAPMSGNMPLTLDNQCEQPASITYRTDAAIRWPLFNVLGR